MADKKATRAMRLAAARELLDRAWGKPAQTLITPDVALWEREADSIDLARRILFLVTSATQKLDEQHESVTDARADADESVTDVQNESARVDS